MLRWLERQRLRFPPLIECTRSCVPETICTALGIRCAVGSAGVAGYGCTGSLLFCGYEWYDSAGSVLALSANCVHTPLRVLVVLLNVAVSALSLLDV